MDKKKRWLIICNSCAQDIPWDNAEVLLAMFGSQGVTMETLESEDDFAVLICPPWQDLYPESQPFVCDKCGEQVAVHKSSQWFIDNHRAEQESASA